MKKTAQEPKVTENPLYHDTWMLLRKYRDVVWSLELSVQQVRRQFQIEYGSSIPACGEDRKRHHLHTGSPLPEDR